MTIDLCTRIWNGRDPWGDHGGAHGLPVDGGSACATSHLTAMACVDVAAVVGYACDRLGVCLPEESVLEAISEAIESRVGFFGIDVSNENATNRVEAAASQEGVVGIAVSPADQGVRPTDDRFVEVLRRASELGLVVMVHNPGLFHPDSDLTFADPRLIDEVLREYRDDTAIQSARIVLGDLGCVPIEQTLAVVAKHERVFVETSAVAGRPGRMRTAIFAAYEFGVASRVLFASGFPRETPERAIERLYSVNTIGGHNDGNAVRVPREVLRQIIEGDALGKLGVKHIWAGSGGGAEVKRHTSMHRQCEGAGLLSAVDEPEEDAPW
ncbi:MAG: amidohydrolase family protein [Phycisphaerales bacterium JB065]